MSQFFVSLSFRLRSSVIGGDVQIVIDRERFFLLG